MMSFELHRVSFLPNLVQISKKFVLFTAFYGYIVIDEYLLY